MRDPVPLRSADGVARITFNRPDRLNALDLATGQGFEDAVAEALGDPALRSVLLSGAGRSFIAAGDLAAFGQAGDLPAAIRALIGPVHRRLKALAAAPVVSVCAVQGSVPERISPRWRWATKTRRPSLCCGKATES